MTRHVIIGAGPAGINAMETIRALDAEARIDLVCDEPAYARMVLPYYLEGKVEQHRVMTGDEAYFEDRGVTTHFGARVASVDTGNRKVTLASGKRLRFDRLLVATGSRAARPKLDGLDRDGVVCMWTLGDADRYLARPRTHTVIVGAGFIAFTILDALVATSERVTFIELESQVLPRMLDGASAAIMQTHLEKHGVEVRTGVRLEKISGHGSGHRLQLDGGEPIDCDAVVIATGVQPNVEFLAGSGIAIGSGRGAGVLVDDELQTSVEGVYAAGDVAEAPDLLTGERRVHAVQPTAVDHGRIAGVNMCGESVSYSGSLIMNILAAQGLEACSFGDWAASRRGASGPLTSQVMENAANRIYRKYVWDGDVMVGGILVGPSLAVTNANDVGMLKGLIQTGVSLGPWKGYLQENPLDLRRAYVASGAGQALLQTTLLSGRESIQKGGGAAQPYRFPALPPRRSRSTHHATLFTGKPD